MVQARAPILVRLHLCLINDHDALTAGQSECTYFCTLYCMDGGLVLDHGDRRPGSRFGAAAPSPRLSSFVHPACPRQAATRVQSTCHTSRMTDPFPSHLISHLRILKESLAAVPSAVGHSSASERVFARGRRNRESRSCSRRRRRR